MRLGLLGRQPHRSAPHSFGAERQRRGDLASVGDAAGCEHGGRRHGVDDLGHEHHRADLAGVATGLGALGDDQVDAGGTLALGVDDRADEAGDEDVTVVGLGHEVVGRRTEGVGDETDLLVRPDDVEQRPPALVGEPHQLVAATASILSRERLDAVAVQQLVEELAVLGGDQLVDGSPRQAALLDADVLGRHDDVDTVRAVADMVVDPVQLDLELARA